MREKPKTPAALAREAKARAREAERQERAARHAAVFDPIEFVCLTNPNLGSANKLYGRKWSTRKVFKGDGPKAVSDAIWWASRRWHGLLITGPIRGQIVWGMPDKWADENDTAAGIPRGDLDNPMKCVFDALTHFPCGPTLTPAQVIADDTQATRVELVKVHSPAAPFVAVRLERGRIERWEEWAPGLAAAVAEAAGWE